MTSLEEGKWWWEQQKIAKKPFSGGTGGMGRDWKWGGAGKMGVPPQKVW